MAYPVFLTHFFSAGVVNLVTGNRYPVTGTINFLLSTLVCALMSLAIVMWFEPNMEKVRSAIRRSKAGVCMEVQP